MTTEPTQYYVKSYSKGQVDQLLGCNTLDAALYWAKELSRRLPVEILVVEGEILTETHSCPTFLDGKQLV